MTMFDHFFPLICFLTVNNALKAFNFIKIAQYPQKIIIHICSKSLMDYLGAPDMVIRLLLHKIIPVLML